MRGENLRGYRRWGGGAPRRCGAPAIVAALVLLAAGVAAPVSETAPGEREFVCFVYHRFGDDRYPSTNISLEALRGQLEFLRRERYTVLTLGDAVGRLQAGTLPQRTAVLTVDDGYASLATAGLPILDEFQVPITLFVNSRSVGGKGMLSWKELADLAARGMEIGNHTASHDYFLNLPTQKRLERFKADIREAQEKIAANLGVEPRVFSYPFGEYDLQMKEAVEELGFQCAVAQNSGVVHQGSDLYALPRFPMGGPYATVAGFSSKARMKALRVLEREPRTPLLEGSGQASLQLLVDSRGIRHSGMQCFVAGRRACDLEVTQETEGAAHTFRVTVKSREELTARRTLCTVTAPSVDGSAWHWFSHVWVRPEIPE